MTFFNEKAFFSTSKDDEIKDTELKINELIDLLQKEHDSMAESAQPERGAFDDLLTLRERGWLHSAPQPRKYLFCTQEAYGQESGFLPEGKMCMIVSPGGCGKTFLLTHCALAAATGTSWLHTKAVKPIKVLFIAAEEDESELWIRFHNMAKHLGFHQNSELLNLALDNIIPLANRGICQRLIDNNGDPKKAYLDLQEVLENDHEIKLVILDPAARFMGSETETDNAAATDWVNLIDALTLTGGCPTVLVAHHTNKAAISPVGNDKVPSLNQSISRGASALVDGCRWLMGLQRSEMEGSQRRIFIKMLKSNYSKLGQMLEFEQDYENSGTLKFIGEVSPELAKAKKIDSSWERDFRSKQGRINAYSEDEND